METVRKAIGCSAATALIFLAAGQAAPAATDIPAQASKPATVDIHNFAFHPGTLDVAKGTKVVFSNSSGVTHTATRANAFDTGHIQPGTSVSVRFTQKGTFPYHCKIHSFMHGKIVVG
jgi:plastocyanin